MGILRSYFMIGFLIGSNINTMSIYSMSLGLLVKSQFFHPGYQMDDIIYTLSAMRATGVRIKIRTIDIPTLSGPTSGDNVYAEFREWVIQATRWTIGAAEVFHYFFVKLLKRNYFLPGLAYFWWFVYYYGFVLCLSGLVAITSLLAQAVGRAHEEYSIESCRPCQSWFNLSDNSSFYTWIMPSFLLFNYLTVFTTAFIMDALVSQILALDEKIHPVRNLLHWLSSQLVLWLYCLVEYRAMFRVAYYGKEVCGHKASEKHALVGLDPVKSMYQGSRDSDIPKHSSRSHSSRGYVSSTRSDSLRDLFDASGGRLARVEETSHGDNSQSDFEDDCGGDWRGSEKHPLSRPSIKAAKQNGVGGLNLSDPVLVFESSQSMDGSRLSDNAFDSSESSKEVSRGILVEDAPDEYKESSTPVSFMEESQRSIPYDEEKAGNKSGSMIEGSVNDILGSLRSQS
jgi:hypothetical protein